MVVFEIGFRAGNSLAEGASDRIWTDRIDAATQYGNVGKTQKQWVDAASQYRNGRGTKSGKQLLGILGGARVL